ncbi:adenosylmethionine-8-amino-7-oxononanoate aminotransferase [Kluyveromyces marxianus]|uniref:Adenosylmethionine-8-amino-7-oxononanoate aminotransferase n=1 Tax=Kluyveromyces marxianus TaxID=4911 RepID=A0ABX6EQF0_KLUMA|nr:adenosylmethionine-8-amino-7-oxononanoate aminotransferase [Kluyveromyces marxianus]
MNDSKLKSNNVNGINALLAFDKAHIWHPYSSMNSNQIILPVLCAKGCKLTLADEQETQLIDGISSWWCMIHGYSDERMNEALKTQIDDFSHVMFGGLTHLPAIRLVQNLLKFIDHPQLDAVFFADSASVAVEVSLKMALQYQFSLNCPKKKKFISLKLGYHGGTMGAMSVCDPVNSMHHFLFSDYVPQNIFVTEPPMVDMLCTSSLYGSFQLGDNYDDETNRKAIKDMEETMNSCHEEICAVILEPILQGAGGMRLYHPKYLIELKKLCLKFDIPLIFDEIATGFGRTGEAFAFKHCDVYQKMIGTPASEIVDVFPDILCVGKALTGGYMTMSAVITSKRIANVISAKDTATKGTFMHGPTFMANPLACAAANASLDILMEGNWKDMVARIEAQLYRELYVELRNSHLYGKLINNLRVVGAAGVIELFEPIDGTFVQKRQVSKGIFIRPFGKLVYIMPPYIISGEELTILTTGIKQLLLEWSAYKIGNY